MSAPAAKTWWLESWWQVLVILLGVIMVAIFLAYSPVTN